MSESNFQKRKSFYRQFLTIYGRKPVLEALQHPQVSCFRLHLAQSNKQAPILDEICKLAKAGGGEICYHSKQELSRLSKNSKQDQGVAADIRWDGYQAFQDWLPSLREAGRPLRILALDGIHNPQNLGMIIRSVAASQIDAMLLPDSKGTALSPLSIKASAGAVFHCPILYCDKLASALTELKNEDTEIISLSSHARQSLFDFQPSRHTVFILGNETDGVSADCEQLSDTQLMIPMHNGIESLNVAITAALIAFQQW
jgi:23S rRNA (guanosine2251-2'-O)-methyltransferase